MLSFPILKEKFIEFSRLPVEERTSEQRKNMVRELQNSVEHKEVDLSPDQFRECLRNNHVLARILAYLLQEYGTVSSKFEDWERNVEEEWERLRRQPLSQPTTTMPLYYSVRTFLMRLKESPNSVTRAKLDVTRFEQIKAHLLDRNLDRGEHVRGRIDELLSIIQGTSIPSADSAVKAATSTYRAVILTALPVEFTAVNAHLVDSREEVHRGTIYQIGHFPGDVRDWKILLVEIGAGNDGAALEAERAISYFRPDVALFVGIAGGIKDVKVGDVVAATKVYGYESGKAENVLPLSARKQRGRKAGYESGKAESVFSPRPDVGQSSYAMEQRSRAEKKKCHWVKRIIGEATTNPQAFVGPIAAGEKVVASTESDVYRFIKRQYGDVLAVEMEGRGFLTATRANDVQALVIRGISDTIDNKSDIDDTARQQLAARHASAFAFEVIAQFEPPRASRTNTNELASPEKLLSGVPPYMNEVELITALEQRSRRDNIYLNEERISNICEQIASSLADLTRSGRIDAKVSESIFGVIRAEGDSDRTLAAKAEEIERLCNPLDLSIVPTGKGRLYKYRGSACIFLEKEEITSKNEKLSRCGVSLSAPAALTILKERDRQQASCGETIVLVFSVENRTCASIASTNWVGQRKRGNLASYNASPPLGILGIEESEIEGILFLAPIWIWREPPPSDLHTHGGSTVISSGPQIEQG